MKYVKKNLKYLMVFTTSLIIVSTILIWWFSPLPPLLDDGPFYGEVADTKDKGSLKQDYPIHNDMRLQVYNNINENKPPIVQLKSKEGDLIWSITPIGYEQTTVRDIEFTNYNCSFLLLACNVSGYVNWTYGKERMNWHIYKWGGLRGYYYSW